MVSHRRIKNVFVAGMIEKSLKMREADAIPRMRERTTRCVENANSRTRTGGRITSQLLCIDIPYEITIKEIKITLEFYKIFDG